MVERLSELNTSDLDVINTAIEEFSADMVNEAPFSLGGDVRAAIDRYDDRIFFIFSICILNSSLLQMLWSQHCRGNRSRVGEGRFRVGKGDLEAHEPCISYIAQDRIETAAQRCWIHPRPVLQDGIPSRTKVLG